MEDTQIFRVKTGGVWESTTFRTGLLGTVRLSHFELQISLLCPCYSLLTIAGARGLHSLATRLGTGTGSIT
jgi:hypothetical protein